MKTRLIIPALIAAACAVGAFSHAANACGFIGCLVDKVVPGVGTGLDDFNRGLIDESPLGNWCATPTGVFGPGPWKPVGAPCHGNGSYGPVYGQVTFGLIQTR